MDSAFALASRLIREVVAEARHLDGNEPDPETLDVLTQMEEHLAGVFRLIAEAQAALLVGWSASANPGYLVRSFGGVPVNMPWNLAPDFPWGDTEFPPEYLEIAKRLRASESSAICLSGTAAIHSAVGHVGDLDYCEYVDATASASLSAAFSVAIALTSRELTSREVRILNYQTSSKHSGNHSDSLVRPWDGAEAFLQKAKEGTQGITKLIGVTKIDGALEVTNMVLVLNLDSSAHPERSSSPFQEAPVGSWLPRVLADWRAISAYVQRLHREARELVTKEHDEPKFAKGLKRAFGLARFVGASHIADSLKELAQSTKIFQRAALHARLKLAEIVSVADQSDLNVYEQPVIETIQALRKELDANAPVWEELESSKKIEAWLAGSIPHTVLPELQQLVESLGSFVLDPSLVYTESV